MTINFMLFVSIKGSLQYQLFFFVAPSGRDILSVASSFVRGDGFPLAFGVGGVTATRLGV